MAGKWEWTKLTSVCTQKQRHREGADSITACVLLVARMGVRGLRRVEEVWKPTD